MLSILWMFGGIHQWSHLVLDFSFGEVFYSISLLVIGLVRFSISSWFSLERSYDYRIYQFFSRLSNLVDYSLSYYSSMILCISVVSIETPLSFLILFIWVFSFFCLSDSTSRFINFVSLFKEPALSFINLFCCLFVSMLFISTLSFNISFFLLTSGFLKYYLLIFREREREWGRDINLSFRLFMYSLVDSYMCLDWG